jgi:hypothetical protein
VSGTELVGLAGGVGDEDVLEALRLEGRAVHDQPIGTYGPNHKRKIVVVVVMRVDSSCSTFVVFFFTSWFCEGTPRVAF